MDILWTPWRASYVEKAARKEDVECVFCQIKDGKKDKENYIVYRGKHSFVVLNIYPYNTGHVMIVPYRHVSSIEYLNKEELFEVILLVKMMVGILRNVYNPDGFNIGANIGRDSGAGIEYHFHVHVVPRWRGDTNFMPIIGKTKVIPEDLDTTYKKLKQALEKRRDERALDL